MWDESMHAYWAIRRQTEKQTKPEQPCDMKFKEFGYTCSSWLDERHVCDNYGRGDDSVSDERSGKPPRSRVVVAGGRTDTTEQHKNRNWKDQLAEDTRKKQRRVVAPKHGVGKATSSGKSLVDLEV